MRAILNIVYFLVLINVSFSCAKKQTEDPFVRCSVVINQDENGNRVNGFWDIDRGYEVNVNTCDEIWPTGLPDSKINQQLN